MLAVQCDQNNRYEITMNGYQARKANEMRKVIFKSNYLIRYSTQRGP